MSRSLQKRCEKEGLPVDTADDAANLAALLERLRDPASASHAAVAPMESAEARRGRLEEAFRGLVCDGIEGSISFDNWLRWDWLAERVGPVGTSALVTVEAAAQLWSREVGDGADACIGLDAFVRLADVLEAECARATAIQAALRGRMGRKAAEETARRDREERAGDLVEGAAVLAPFNPTPSCAIEQALEALEVGPADIFYDLGCGDGRVLLAAAGRGARCLGVEYDGQLALRAQQAVAGAGFKEHAEIIHGDACSCDLVPATKIFVYLVPTGLARLSPALTEALHRGVPVASYTFSIPGEEPVSTLTAPTRAPECKVRLYRSNST